MPQALLTCDGALHIVRRCHMYMASVKVLSELSLIRDVLADLDGMVYKKDWPREIAKSPRPVRQNH